MRLNATVDKSHTENLRIVLATCGAWRVRQIGAHFQSINRLAGVWNTEKNITGIRKELFHRCWPFHLFMKPFYQFGSQITRERAFYAAFPIWRSWIRRRRLPRHDVTHAILGYGTELFDVADSYGAIKVIDCPNSHPTTCYGFWQRECDLWAPGETVSVPRWMFSRWNREIERADLIVVQSKFCKESMLLNGVPENKVFINPVGVDTKVFTKRPSVPEKIRFICVGTISVRKGHQYLFPAFQIVKGSLPESELICVGGIKHDFRREIRRWRGTFTHIGRIGHQELARLLHSATAFVFPSQEEGIAKAQVEALASGLPVIGTHYGGTTTLVSHGVEGFIVNGRDPSEIADAMVRIATDRDLNARMGDAAYKSGASANSWSDYSDRLIDAYTSTQMKLHKS